MNMPTEHFLPLQKLMQAGRDSDWVVAWRHGEASRWSDFECAVSTLTVQFQQYPQLRWGIYLKDGYLFVAALLALLHSGKIPVLTGSNLPGAALRLSAQVDVLLGDFEPVDGATVIDVNQLLASQQRDAELSFVELDDGQTLELFTSGSTGEPKREEKQLRQVFAELQTLETAWGERLANAVATASVSHQHIYGLLFKILWPLSAGRAFVSRSYQDPQALLEDTSNYPRFAWVASPAHLKRLHNELPWEKVKHNLAAVFSSGGLLPAGSARQLKQWQGEPPIEVYGSTESGGIAWRQQWCETDKSDNWRPFPGIELSQGERGALHIRSPHLPQGAKLAMADAVKITATGSFQLLGRLDRIVKIEGKRLSLPELETTLAQSPAVSEARALLLEQGGRQLVGVAVVLTGKGQQDYREFGKATLVRQLKAGLSFEYEAVLLPRKWRFVEQLPVNPQGKFMQNDLQTLFTELPQNSVAEQPGSDIKTLPKVLSESRSDNELTLNLYVESDLAYLPGHFPSAPIVPGVVQIRWADHFSRQQFPMGKFASMDAIKFQKVLRPKTDLRLTLAFDETKNTVAFRFQSDSGVHSQGRLKFV